MDEDEEDFRPKYLFVFFRGLSWLNTPRKNGFKKTRPALP
jgi:hypothetical protein